MRRRAALGALGGLGALAAPGGAVVLLGACASLPPPLPPERSYSGRFAATATLDGRSDSQSGRFVLQTRGAELTLDLATPLGTTLARLQDGPEGARLRAPAPDGRMQEVQGASAEALALQLLGWPLPLAGIRFWIEGRPMPGAAVQLRGADGADLLQQDGWTIAVQERFADGLPRRLQITRPALAGTAPDQPPQPALNLRLVLDEPGGAAQ